MTEENGKPCSTVTACDPKTTFDPSDFPAEPFGPLQPVPKMDYITGTISETDHVANPEAFHMNIFECGNLRKPVAITSLDSLVEFCTKLFSSVYGPHSGYLGIGTAFNQSMFNRDGRISSFYLTGCIRDGSSPLIAFINQFTEAAKMMDHEVADGTTSVILGLLKLYRQMRHSEEWKNLPNQAQSLIAKKVIDWFPVFLKALSAPLEEMKPEEIARIVYQVAKVSLGGYSNCGFLEILKEEMDERIRKNPDITATKLIPRYKYDHAMNAQDLPEIRKSVYQNGYMLRHVHPIGYSESGMIHRNVKSEIRRGNVALMHFDCQIEDARTMSDLQEIRNGQMNLIKKHQSPAQRRFFSEILPLVKSRYEALIVFCPSIPEWARLIPESDEVYFMIADPSSYMTTDLGYYLGIGVPEGTGQPLPAGRFESIGDFPTRDISRVFCDVRGVVFAPGGSLFFTNYPENLALKQHIEYLNRMITTPVNGDMASVNSANVAKVRLHALETDQLQIIAYVPAADIPYLTQLEDAVGAVRNLATPGTCITVGGHQSARYALDNMLSLFTYVVKEIPMDLDSDRYDTVIAEFSGMRDEIKAGVLTLLSLLSNAYTELQELLLQETIGGSDIMAQLADPESNMKYFSIEETGTSILEPGLDTLSVDELEKLPLTNAKADTMMLYCILDKVRLLLKTEYCLIFRHPIQNYDAPAGYEVETIGDGTRVNAPGAMVSAR